MRLSPTLKRTLLFFLFLWWMLVLHFKYCQRVELPANVAAYLEANATTAQQVYDETGVPATIMLAVSGLESGWGRSELAQRGNNYFGIKARGNQPSYCLLTAEYFETQRHQVKACFRAYPTPVESFRDYALFLRQQPRYAHLFDLPRRDYAQWAVGLQAAGYATDPVYAQKIIRVIREYQLDRW